MPTPATGTVQQVAPQIAPYSQEATIGAKNLAVDLGKSILGIEPTPQQAELPPFQLVEDEEPVVPPVQQETQQSVPVFQMVD
jgi:hypothetical protein